MPQWARTTARAFKRSFYLGIVQSPDVMLARGFNCCSIDGLAWLARRGVWAVGERFSSVPTARDLARFAKECEWVKYNVARSSYKEQGAPSVSDAFGESLLMSGHFLADIGFCAAATAEGRQSLLVVAKGLGQGLLQLGCSKEETLSGGERPLAHCVSVAMMLGGACQSELGMAERDGNGMTVAGYLNAALRVDYDKNKSYEDGSIGWHARAASIMVDEVKNALRKSSEGAMSLAPKFNLDGLGATAEIQLFLENIELKNACGNRGSGVYGTRPRL